MIELTFVKELMLIAQVNQKSMLFVNIFFKKNKGIKFEPNVCNGCHNLLMMSMKLRDTDILNIKGSDYCFIVSGISKSGWINLLQNIRRY